MGNGVRTCWDLVRTNYEDVNLVFKVDGGNENFLSRRQGLDDDDSVDVFVEENVENDEVIDVKRRDDGESITKNQRLEGPQLETI